ncbi:MAG: SDR family oxidoreductase [Proteobacteria bacterium]|nr:SDR family oxidoreductase [Pseudomonadota bacterium]
MARPRPKRTSKPLAGQVAIVTGGARGIGLGIALRLNEDGAQVVIWDRDLTPLRKEARHFKPAQARCVDVSDLAEVERAFAEAMALAGQVHILINNAGINGPVAPAWEYPVEAWADVLAVDLTGVFHCCRPAAAHMLKEGYGRIVNIASIAGKEGMPGIAAYSAAKAGVIGFTKALARELVTTGVTANCITPVITETKLFRQMTAAHIKSALARIPMGRFCSIQEIAAMTAYVASPDCSFTTGAVFDISGGRATY